MIKIYCVGKMTQKYLSEGIEYYQKQLPIKIEWIEVSDEKNAQGIRLEGDRLLAKIKPSDYLIALAIDGIVQDSESFSKTMEQAMTYQTGDICFVIGGSHGLSSEVLQRANVEISFSKMTFPHQLMRLILMEQIYRGFMIMKKHPYHK